MNVRMVNATFEDSNKPDFDADANTNEFIARIPEYAACGVRAFTLCLQGGMPGYEGAINSAFHSDGSLREDYLGRVRRVIEACDRHGVAIILTCFYQRQSERLRDDAAVRAGVVNVARWIRSSGFQNVLLDIANEYPHRGFVHSILRDPQGEAKLIRLAKEASPGLLVSASGIGNGKLHDAVAEASDFLLLHFNGVQLKDIPSRVEPMKRFHHGVFVGEQHRRSQFRHPVLTVPVIPVSMRLGSIVHYHQARKLILLESLNLSLGIAFHSLVSSLSSRIMPRR